MATIDPLQDYDVIHTLTFAAGSGTCAIRLYLGSSSEYSGTVYYRAGTSGAWTPLSVSGTGTTFPVSSTTMQIGHAHNKSGDNYMTVSFRGASSNLVEIAISQKAIYSGAAGNYFMAYYARDCTGLTSLAVPDTSGMTSAGSYFMYNYAYNCTGLTSLAVPDTSGMTSAGSYFMYNYARDCTGLTSLAVPDTSGMTSAGSNFMAYYAYNCTALLRLELPAVGRFASNNVDWSVPSTRLNYIKGYVTNSADLAAWQALTVSPKTLYLNYIRSSGDVILEGGGGAGRLIGSKSRLIGGPSPLIGGPSPLIG